MSRKTMYSDSRLTVITGDDHALGLFYQIYDRQMIEETPEQEGLVLDWSQLFGFEVNYTGLSKDLSVTEMIKAYICDNGDSKDEINLS
jgi:hypothetical protein